MSYKLLAEKGHHYIGEALDNVRGGLELAFRSAHRKLVNLRKRDDTKSGHVSSLKATFENLARKHEEPMCLKEIDDLGQKILRAGGTFNGPEEITWPGPPGASRVLYDSSLA